MVYKFENKWDEDVNMSWWKSSRIELNKIIDAYNEWQIDGFDKDKSNRVLALIEYGKQTIGSRDGGEGYFEVLLRMQSFVSICLKK